MHGRFGYQHPWDILENRRSNAPLCLQHRDPKFQKAAGNIKKHLKCSSMRLSLESSKVLKELTNTIESMKNSSGIEELIEEMNNAVVEVHCDLSSLTLDDFETKVAALTMASLPSEITVRIEGMANAVSELADMASFQPFEDEPPALKTKQDEKLPTEPNGQEESFQQVKIYLKGVA